jgi:hypothetical protein
MEDLNAPEANNEAYLQKLQDYMDNGCNSHEIELGTMQSVRCAAHTVQLAELDLMSNEMIKKENSRNT